MKIRVIRCPKFLSPLVRKLFGGNRKKQAKT